VNYFIKIILFLLSIVASLGGVYHILFFRSDSIYISFAYAISIMIIFVGLLVVWRLLYKRYEADKYWDVRLKYAGYVATTIPAVAFIGLALQQTHYLIQAKLFTSQTEVSKYQEESIKWNGFDTANGLRISITLDHPVTPPGYFHYPKIIMGKNGESIPEDPERAYWKFCAEPVIDSSSCLTSPVWPMKPFPVLSEKSPSTVTFELYPSNLYYVESENRVCLKKRSPYSEVSFVGLNTVALWHYLAGDHKLDMSGLMTETIRKESKVLKDIDLVQKMYRNAESGAFLAAGYQGCEIKKAVPFTNETECFCKDSQPNDSKDKASKDNKSKH